MSTGKLVWIAHTYEIGIDLLSEVSRQRAKIQQIEEEKQKRENHQVTIKAFSALKRSKEDVSIWTVDELKVAIKVLNKVMERLHQGRMI